MGREREFVNALYAWMASFGKPRLLKDSLPLKRGRVVGGRFFFSSIRDNRATAEDLLKSVFSTEPPRWLGVSQFGVSETQRRFVSKDTVLPRRGGASDLRNSGWAY